MNPQQVLQIAILIVAVLLIFLTSLQGKGGGIKSSVGSRALYSTRRGAEKFVFRATIVLGILFASLSLANIFI